jgi:predicted permease
MPFLDHVRHDIHFALRQLRRAPVFTLTAVGVFAVGLCASVAIFAFFNAALLKPLPYREANRLAGVYETVPLCQLCNLSYFDYLDWKRINKTLASLDVYQGTGFILDSASGAERAQGGRVSAGFFRTLGVSPILGRDFMEGEDQPSAAYVVILSYSTWKNRFGGRREAVGESIRFDGVQYTIVGVLPPDFHFAPAGPVEFWSAIHATTSCEQRRGCHDLYGVGRLKDGVSFEDASADFALIAGQLEAQYPDSNRGQASNILPLSEVIVGRVRPILTMLLAGATLLLLIAAVNVANLLLVRSEGRKREIAIRSGLGASPARLASQFITEGILLVLFSAAVGLFGAQLLSKLLMRFIPQSMLSGLPFLNDLGLHAREWTFAAVVSVLAVILFTLTPLLRLSFSNNRSPGAESSRGYSGIAWRNLGSYLVIVELATAVVLLTGAGLLGKSLYRVLQVDLGMKPDHLAIVQVGSPQTSYSKDDQFVALNRELLRRVSSLPGVTNAATTSTLPIAGGNTRWIRFADRPFYGEKNEVAQRYVTIGYFTTLRARLQSGRYFTESDDTSKPRVIIIDRALAAKYYPSKSPIGQQIFFQSGDQKPVTIVGVIDDIKEGAIDSTGWPTMYIPFAQDPGGYFNLVVRTAQDERALLPTLVSTIHRLDAGLMTGFPRTMADQVNNSPAAYLRRSSASLAMGFAVVALILGVIGMYGVIAYSVSQRTREIGVRIALGAQRHAVYQLVLKEAAWLMGVGVAVGLLCSIGAAALLRSLLFGTKAEDPGTLAAVTAVLIFSAFMASIVPAHRAASVDPVAALRAE